MLICLRCRGHYRRLPKQFGVNLNQRKIEVGGKLVSRPCVTGDPLVRESDPATPKPHALIDIHDDGQLKLVDRKLFNVLLALSWQELADDAREAVFAAPAPLLRRAIGQERQRGNKRLKESLARLVSTVVVFPRLQRDGHNSPGRNHLLSRWTISSASGLVGWEYPAVLRPVLAECDIWTRLHLDVCARFNSKYSLILYELLSVRAGLRKAQWIVAPEELAAYLGVSRKAALYWANLRDDVLFPALAEVNELAKFRAELDVEPGRAGRRLTFRMLPKA